MNKLVVAILQSRDANAAIDALISLGVRATRIESYGGYLKRKNATIVMGIEQGQLDLVVQTLSEFSEPREEDGVKIGAGAVFVLEASQITPI